MFHAFTCAECHTQAQEAVQEAKEPSEESEDDWEANTESWEDMVAVPAIGPAAVQAKQKVPLYTLFVACCMQVETGRAAMHREP